MFKRSKVKRLSTGEQMLALYWWRSGQWHLLTEPMREWLVS